MDKKYIKLLFNERVVALIRRAGTFVAGVLAAHGATAQDAETVGLMVAAILGLLWDTEFSTRSRKAMRRKVEREITKKLHTSDRHVTELRQAAMDAARQNREMGQRIIEANQESEE